MNKLGAKIFGATALPILLGTTVAMAQTSAPASQPANMPVTIEKNAPPPASTTTVTDEGLILTEEQAKNWIDKSVFSSDEKNVGEVAVLQRDTSGKAAEMQVDVGGFLGIGQTRVQVMPSQFKFVNDRVVLSLTAEQVKTLPKIVN